MAITPRTLLRKQTGFYGLWLFLLTLIIANICYAQSSNVHLRGVVVPQNQVKISLNQTGVVTFIASSGSIVRQGDVLAQIDPQELSGLYRQAQAQLNSADAELAAAAHNLEKTRRLVNEDILSEIALTEAQFSVKTATAQVAVHKSKYELAKLALAQAELLAPFDGVVAETKVKAGEWAAKAEPVIEFASLSDLIITIDIPPELTEQLSEGDVTAVLYQGTPIGKATVKRLFPLLQPSSGLRRIVWQVETDKPILISGRYVELEAWF